MQASPFFSANASRRERAEFAATLGASAASYWDAFAGGCRPNDHRADPAGPRPVESGQPGTNHYLALGAPVGDSVAWLARRYGALDLSPY